MTDLTTLSIAEAGGLMARGELTSTALTEAFLARIEAVDHKIASFVTLTADRARNAARQADMEMSQGLRSRPPARHSDRAEGHLRDRGRADDRPFAPARRLRARGRRRDRAAPEGGRRRHPGQARDPRIRQRRDDAGPALPAGAQSLEHRLPARRLVERLGRRRGRRALHGRHGLRHRRLDPQSRRASAARPASSRPMAWSAAAASSRCRSASTRRARSPGRSRTTR